MKTFKKRVKQTLILFIFLFGVYIVSPYLISHNEQVTVTKTERVDGRYLIFTNKGVYEDVDDFRVFKWNSSDIYSKLSTSIGKPVYIKTTGFRIPFLSMYKNIISIKE